MVPMHASGGICTLDVSTLETGIYIIELRLTNGRTMVAKLEVIH